jgi:hypothetical protein
MKYLNNRTVMKATQTGTAAYSKSCVWVGNPIVEVTKNKGSKPKTGWNKEAKLAPANPANEVTE